MNTISSISFIAELRGFTLIISSLSDRCFGVDGAGCLKAIRMING